MLTIKYNDISLLDAVRLCADNMICNDCYMDGDCKCLVIKNKK